jgi:hypothetical protein
LKSFWDAIKKKTLAYQQNESDMDGVWYHLDRSGIVTFHVHFELLNDKSDGLLVSHRWNIAFYQRIPFGGVLLLAFLC